MLFQSFKTWCINWKYPNDTAITTCNLQIHNAADQNGLTYHEFRTSQIYLQASSWQLAVLEHYCLANENGKVHPMSRATIPGRIWWAYLTMTAPMIFTVLFFPSWCPDTMSIKRMEMLKAQEDSKAIEAWLIERLGQRSLPAEKEHIMSKK